MDTAMSYLFGSKISFFFQSQYFKGSTIFRIYHFASKKNIVTVTYHLFPIFYLFLEPRFIIFLKIAATSIISDRSRIWYWEWHQNKKIAFCGSWRAKNNDNKLIPSKPSSWIENLLLNWSVRRAEKFFWAFFQTFEWVFFQIVQKITKWVSKYRTR